MSTTRKQGAEINIDLWPGDCWENSDLGDMQEVVVPFGTVDGQRSHDLRGMGLQVTLSFITGAVAGGFFGALGGHLYEQLVERIRTVVRRPQQRHPEWDDEENADSLFFIVQDGELRLSLHMYGIFGSDEELGEYLRLAPAAYRAIVQAIVEGRSPCLRGKAHSIRATWSNSEEPQWDISVLVREGDDPKEGTLLLGLNAFVASHDLTASEWPFIQWMDLESARLRRASRSGSL